MTPAETVELEMLRDWLDIALDISPDTVRIDRIEHTTMRDLNSGCRHTFGATFTTATIKHVSSGVSVGVTYDGLAKDDFSELVHKLRGALIERILEGRK